MIKSLVKKLDLLIIKAWIGPFIATFFITTFVLVLQFFWLYIDDIVGKGVDTMTVLRLISYVAATLVPLALPLAVLLSSIMTFGNLGESFELVAIKSAGIPLLRFMRPLFICSFFICWIAFAFNNNIIPIANLKMNTLKYDIIVSKPAFDIKEGVFYDKIEGYVIKIGKKEKDDSTIRNVVIYEQNFSGLQDNIIVADSGKMVVTPDKHALQFILQHGWIYQEGKGARTATNTEFIRMGFTEYKKVLDLTSFKLNKTDDNTFKNNSAMWTMPQLGRAIDSLEKLNVGYRKKSTEDLKRTLTFAKYVDTSGWASVEKGGAVQSKFLLDKPTDPNRAPQSGAQPVYTPPPSGPHAPLPGGKPDTGHHGPFATAQAQHRLDSLHHAHPDMAHHGTPPNGQLHPAPGTLAAAQAKRRLDSLHRLHPDTAHHGTPVTAQTQPPAGTPPPAQTQNAVAQAKPNVPAAKPALPAKKEVSFHDYLPDSVRTAIFERTISEINAAKITIDQPSLMIQGQDNELRTYRIGWHEKLTLSVACMVMFLIGAPLGSIIRKGGIGMPLICAVIFFVIFFLLNNFGKKFVKEDVLSPFGGMWMATYVLTPIGIFLTYKAMHDSQLFNMEYYYRAFRSVRAFFRRKGQGPADGSGSSGRRGLFQRKNQTA